MGLRSTQVILLASLAVAHAAHAADGDLDASFQGFGEASAFQGTTAGGNVQVLAQPDGAVVLVGIVASNSALGVTRLHEDGSTDASFGTNGQTLVAVPGAGQALNVSAALDASGRVVAAATVDYGDHSVMFVTRLTSGGQLDSTFNHTGMLAIARTFVPAQGDSVAAIGVFSDPVAASADDTILVAGSLQDQYGHFNARNLAVVPLHADGSYFTNAVGNSSFFFGAISDVAFCYRAALAGGSGYDTAAAVARRWFPGSSSEVIAVAGNAFSSGTVPDFGVVVELDGSLHPIGSFGISGYSSFIFAASGTAQVNAIALDDSNRVVVAGIDASTSHYNLAVGRILTTGYYDTSFNGNGRAIIDFDESAATFYSEAQAVLIQRDGRMLVGAQVIPSSVAATAQFGLVRLTVGGVADATFTSGTTIAGAHKYAFTAGNDYANSAGFTQGEKVLLAGIVGQPNDAYGVLRVTNEHIFGDGVEAPVYLPRIP